MPDKFPVTSDEYRSLLKESWQQQEQARLEGVKYFRLQAEIATPVSGTVAIGTSGKHGPHAGYCWSIRRLSASGLGTGTSPDILNIYRNGTVLPPIWQLNGNNWGYSFGPTEMLLLPGENIQAASLGSMTSTTQVTLSADIIELPQQMIGKLVV